MRTYTKLEYAFRTNIKPIFVKLFFSCVTYGIMICNNLVNKNDGVWSGTYYYAGNWELSLGRWLWRYVDIAHFGISVHPLSTVLALLIFAIGTTVLIDVIEIKVGSLFDYIISFLILSNMFVCVSISYLYMSLTFALAFLLSTISVQYIKKAIIAEGLTIKAKYCIISALIISCVAGLYQSYLGCLIVLALLNVIVLTDKMNDVKSFFRNTLTTIVCGVGGIAAYIIEMSVFLKIYEVKLADYQGASNISILNIIQNFPRSIIRCYTIFAGYFIGNSNLAWNIFPGLIVSIICLVLILVLIIQILSLENKYLSLLYLITLLLLPICANITILVAPDSHYLEQQSAPLGMIIPALIALLYYFINGKMNAEKFKKITMAACGVIIIIGSTYWVQVDQEAMRQGTVAVQSLSNSVINSIINSGIYEDDKEVAFLGESYKNPLFYANSLYYRGNSYTRMAGPLFGSGLNQATYSGFLQNEMGVKLSFCSMETYNNLLKSTEYENMPVYPNDGSIRDIDGVIVVKLSD